MDAEGRRELITAFYERITVTSDVIVIVELPSDAQRHGATLALPETVPLARPEGLGQRRTAHKAPIKDPLCMSRTSAEPVAARDHAPSTPFIKL